MPVEELAPLAPSVAPVSLHADAPAVARSHARYYRPELDVLRALAFLLVFSSHVLPFPHAAADFTLLSAVQEGVSGGVPLFFILTSFLITELLLREHEATGTVHIRAFYVRRILRIWPLYFLALGLAFALPHVAHSFDPIGRWLLPFLLLGGNFVITSHGWFHNPLLTPLWSTPVQEQFYLLWPLLYLAFGVKGILRSALVLLPLAWALDYMLPAMHFTRSPVLWCNSVNQFQFFALGSVLAVLTHRRTLRLSGLRRGLLFLGGAAAFFLSGTPFHFINDFMPATPLQTLAGYLCLDAGCVMLCLALLGMHVPSWLHPMTWLGKISFGMYIFHYTLLAIVAVAVKKLHFPFALQLTAIYAMTLLLSVAVGTVSYRYFEMPFLRLKSRFTFIRSRPA